MYALKNCFLQDLTILFDLSFSRFRLTQSTSFQLTRDWGSNLGRLKKFRPKIFNDSFAQNFCKIVAALRDKIFCSGYVCSIDEKRDIFGSLLNRDIFEGG